MVLDEFLRMSHPLGVQIANDYHPSDVVFENARQIHFMRDSAATDLGDLNLLAGRVRAEDGGRHNIGKAGYNGACRRGSSQKAATRELGIIGFDFHTDMTVRAKAVRPTYRTQTELAEGWSEADEAKRRSTWSWSNILGIRDVLSRAKLRSLRASSQPTMIAETCRLCWRRKMKATVAIMLIPVAAGLGVWLAFERQAALKLGLENEGLRQRLSQMEEPAENQRVSNQVPSPPNQTAETPPRTEADELVRLRGEVAALRDQTKEIEKLRADTRVARAATETALRTSAGTAGQLAPTVNESQFEVLAAGYGTETTNLDVAMELQARVRGDSLKAVASNNLKGDPDFGKVKHLTVVYRFRGVTMTNEFREGDLVILPKEQQP